MTDPRMTEIFQELLARGLIAATPAPQLLARGNVDRADTTRQSWLVPLPSGERAKLTFGRDLAALAIRHAALAHACPDVATRQLHHVRLVTGDVLLETFFDGTTLELVVAGQLLPSSLIRLALTGICASLASTEAASRESTRVAEWNAWTERLLALPVWQPSEVRSLKDLVLPALYPRLASGPPVTRWTNGDFLPANILLNAGREARLIDAEFATRTHFFAEDAVRFRVLSSVAQDHPDLFGALLPEPDLSWHLFFWLRQFQLEIEHNSAVYVARVQAGRLGLIRRLAEMVLGVALPGWSSPAFAVEHCVEDIRWLPDAGGTALVSGWCHLPAVLRLRALVALGAAGRLAMVAPADRPDVQQHFHGEPGALRSGFALEIKPGPADFPLTLCALIEQGTLVPFHLLAGNDLPRGAMDWSDYPVWAAQFDPDPAQTANEVRGPLLSILLPVYRTPETHLRACLSSVQAQYYSHWELCLVDDGSAQPGLTAWLGGLAAIEPRVRFQTRASNGGIAAATNDALAMARGEFVVLLDHDDLLRPHALEEFVRRLTREPALDVIYSDEDKITTAGQRLIPLLKPDYSPEFLLGVMYIGHALCVRTSMARSCGGFDPGYDGIQDYEFFLRLTERTSRIGHIPRILYHWRQSPDSSALHGNIKGDMDQKQVAAVQAHLQRRGDRRTARALGGHRVRLEDPATPIVELIQPTSPAAALAALCQAAATSMADVLLVVSTETRESSPDRLRGLAALAALPDSGCVAPLLLSKEGRVYESGLGGGHALMRGFHPESDGYHGSLRCNREVDAVSPACFAVRRSVVAAVPAAQRRTWPEFVAHLRTQGLHHRVCASVRVQLSIPWTGTNDDTVMAPAVREFHNPHFDGSSGDYTLATASLPWGRTPSRPQFHVDQPGEWHALPRCLIVRGWCYSRPDFPVTGIRLRSAGLTLAGIVGLSRPDVSATLADAPGDHTGFEIRGTLRSGRQQVRLEVQLAGGAWYRLLSRPTAVQGRIRPLWLGGGDWMELMFFQMPAHMAYPARTLRLEKFPAPTRSGRPKLSIVTPSYNHARFLPETMRSVLEQADVTCSYVVQDGGSTDGSAEYIKGHAGRLHAWTSERDGGQADAIGRGFAQTSGAPEDVMAWINSDDFYLPGALAHVADYFARHPEVDVVYGHRILVNEESQEIGRWFLPRHDPAVLRLNDFVPQETLFWRRRIWDKVGGIAPSFNFAMDWDLLLRFQAAGAKIVRLPRFLACFRVHAAQKTAARMHDLGQKEISLLRERTHGRPFPPQELEQNPLLLGYLRRSAFIEFLWRLGIRAP